MLKQAVRAVGKCFPMPWPHRAEDATRCDDGLRRHGDGGVQGRKDSGQWRRQGLAVAGVNQNSVCVVFNQLGYCTCARGNRGRCVGSGFRAGLWACLPHMRAEPLLRLSEAVAVWLHCLSSRVSDHGAKSQTLCLRIEKGIVAAPPTLSTRRPL